MRDPATPQAREAKPDAPPLGFEEEGASGVRDQPPNPLRGLRALVVEDDPDNLEVLTCLLIDEGVDVRAADSGEAARSAMVGFAPDVLLIDLSLPDEDGCTLLNSLRAGLVVRTVPAIAMTGYTDPEARAQIASAGFELHLGKPYEMAHMIGAIASLVRKIGT